MNQRPPSRRGVGQRTEPVVGELAADHQMHERSRRRGPQPPRRPPPRHRRSLIALLVVVLLVALGALAWSQRATIRSWLPSTAYNDLLKRADAALAAGNLDCYDATSACELYRRAVHMEPDDARARDGLRQVGKAELAQARAALAAGNLQQATLALGQARALLGGGSDLDAFAGEIDKARGRGVKIASLVNRAQQAVIDGHLSGKDGAAALYQQVLAADPDNAVARHGLDGIGQRYARDIRTALQQHALDEARSKLEQLGEWLPDFANLPGLRADVAQAERDAQAALQARLAKARADLVAGRLAGAGDDNALAGFRAVLAADADNEAARAGVRQVAAALLKRADAALDAGNRNQASADIEQLTAIDPASPQLATLRQRLAAAAAASQAAPGAPAAPAPLGAAQKKKVAGLLVRAQAALEAGDLMQPPATNAYDLYHQVLAIDAGNADAMAGLASLPSVTRQGFRVALKAHKLQRAGQLLAAFGHMVPGSSAHAPMQKMLADAWAQQARQAAAAGDGAAARQALAQLRKLAPDDPRIATIAEQLGSGGP
ncbi:MAG TPA: hypothetical protein VFG73_01525 [Rhodanobacteraceae bacterium]|nr:hypothetical protein [Rhodanobacteraceae bacterium]